jgi:hypothetical protein
MRGQFVAIAAMLAVAACGSSAKQGAPSSSRASASAQQHSSGPFIAVASGLPGAQLVNFYPIPTSATVKIVDASGKVYASATFVPPPAPLIGPAAALLQSPVRTAAGALFYADNAGAVHKLTPDGATSVVATFPLTSSQQELTYAVSPDGAHLIAIVVSLPPVHNPPPQTLGDPLYQTGGRWSVKVQTADSGGPTTTTFERDLGTTYPQVTEIVGWDNRGPLATLSTQLGAQQAPPSAHIFGKLIHIAPDGTHLEPIGGSDCTAVDELADGTVLCDSDWQSFSVRTSAGAILWQRGFPSQDYYFGLWLSPDGNAVAAQNIVLTASSVASTARQAAGTSSGLVAVGWLNVSTVVEADQQSGQLSLYRANGMVKLRDLGVSGIFEGLL